MKILGVTGCPTGIAHTFMAEKALKEAAKELGCEIKVETNGAIGVENALTAKDIQEADAIIVACDKNVDMERFNGRPVIDVSVTEGINHAKELIQKCIDKKVPIRKGNVKISNYNQGEKVSFGRQIYKHLMNGVSHMLPLVVAGGVLTAISFLWGIYSFDPTSPQYNAIAATIKEVGGYSMNLMVPVLTAFIAQSIAGRPGMLAGFVAGMIASATGSGFIGGIIGGFAGGYFTQFVVNLLRNLPRQLEGLKSIFIVPIITVLVVGVGMILLGGPCSMLNESMMSFLEGMQKSSPVILGLIIGCMSAFDMGGPVNKAAYVTGTMLLAQGNYLFMAGVSAACITPPLIIALAATFKKDRFTEEDRTAGLINYVLGCTHITEGAIPFAAKNPLKVIPVLMAGSSISAIATYIMKVEVPAPHGGFLILGLVNKPLIWITCILLGSAIGAVLYVLVTPKVEVAIDGQDVSVVNDVEKNETKHDSQKNDLYKENTVCMNLKSKTKQDVINEMVELLDKNGILNNKNEFKKEILEREELSSTGFGNGIAIPHAKTSAVKIPRVAVGISKDGFDFDSVDGNKANLIFMIAAGDDDNDLHLKTLSHLAQNLMDDEFVKEILNSKSKKEIVQLLSR
ncbi:fructose-specific PTS transporter subunit EIIC [Intestinibacter bartlettii]|uniref:fructose-specific PTS transporter subunit EIIC n=1 Tax=Intestinibacter bartlettii TaxID=261299 RepID=UPI0006C30AC3|nr:fructose-specific PTS transporter subunit EIIC [Intestinibacter bartlettii]MCC2707671.1 fructose-specific PTS transporter subunit EIIC [Intestinibacter bartlettii]MCC2763121.1 fructose-specific PTS transporter subunit EIIC [Intestinibacter bartlettii]CUO52829.1 PTS system transporter subunit IIABC [Intestinibacter bartlettii]